MEDVELAVFRRREAGTTVVAELLAGEPPLLVEFKVPDKLQAADCEARARRAVMRMRAAPAELLRYGLPPGPINDDNAEAAFTLALSVEGALGCWTDWNYSVEPGVKAPLDAAHVSDVLADPTVRAIWEVHFRNVTSLERAEKKGFGSSPDTSSDGGPNTAQDAPRSPRRARSGSPEPQGGSASAPPRNRRRPKDSSSDASA